MKLYKTSLCIDLWYHQALDCQKTFPFLLAFVAETQFLWLIYFLFVMLVVGNSLGDAKEGSENSRCLHCDASYEVGDCVNNIFSRCWRMFLLAMFYSLVDMFAFMP